MNDGLFAYCMSIPGKYQSLGMNHFSMCPSKADSTHGLARHCAGWSCDTGGGECDIGIGIDECAFGHFGGDFFADCTVLRDQGGADLQKLGLGAIRVSHKPAVKPFGGTSDIGNGLRDATAGDGFGRPDWPDG